MKAFLRPFTAVFILLCSFALFGSPKTGYASHGSGLDLTYEHLGGMEYRLRLGFYRFCDGISEPSSVTIDISSASCNQNLSVTLNKSSVSQGDDVTPFCASVSTNCTDPNSQFPGIERYVYTGTVTLPSACPDWVFEYSLCCRDGSITTINNPSGEDIHVSTRLDNQNYPNNTSPQFNNPPVSYFCVGQKTCFNQGVTEPDGDSLSYRLVTPTTGGGNTVNYNAGYSGTQPLQSSPPVSINDSTGTICVNATTPDVTVMEVEVVEWRNGDSIGVVHRDIRFKAIDCSVSPYNNNNNPYINGIDDSTGHFNITVCEGDSVDFNIPAHDSDASQNVSLSWNQGISSGVFDPGTGSNPVGNFQWETDTSHGGATHCFTVSVTDDNCPLQGTQTYSFCIDVLDVDSTLNNTQISYGSGTFCYDAPDQTPTVTGMSGGRFWASSPALDLDTATGTIDVQNSVADSSYTVYYQTPDSLKCSVIDSVPITIDSIGNANFHYPDTSYCETGNIAVPQFVSGGSHGIFKSSDPANLKVDSIYGVVDIQASEEGIYEVYNEIPGSGSCPSDTDTATIIIEDLPFAAVSPDMDSICNGDTYTMNGTYAGGTSQITWTTFGDGSFNDVNDTSAIYTPGASDKSSGSVEILIESDSVQVCPADEDTMELTIMPKPTLDVGQDDTICADGSLDLSASIGGSGIGVKWNSTGDGFFDDSTASSTVYHPGSNDRSSGTVTLYAETKGYGFCVPETDSLELTIIPLADPSFSYPDYSYCKSNDQVTATIEGDTGGVFTVDPPGGLDIDSSTGAIDLSGSYADFYDITYTVGERCPNDTTVQFTVHPIPNKPDPTGFSVCPGGTGTLTVPGDPDSVTWFSDANGNNVLSTDSVYSPDPQTLSQPGTYTYYVKVINNGCPSQLGSVDVIVNSYANVGFKTVPDPAIGVKPFDVLFNNTSGPAVSDYNMDFGNGTSASFMSWNDTSVTYPQKGQYTVTLTGVDTLTGCAGSAQLVVEVVDEAQAKLPNVFTPNGDGQNDEFKPRLGTPCPDKEESGETCWNGIESFQGTIFNRWGNKVYQWNDWNSAWNGENASAGTYYYVIEATGANGQRVEYKGQVTLLRKGN